MGGGGMEKAEELAELQKRLGGNGETQRGRGRRLAGIQELRENKERL